MMTATEGVACLLLRQPLNPMLENLPMFLKEARLRERNEEITVTRFSEILKEALGWPRNTRDWCLHGTLRGRERPVTLRMAGRHDLSYAETLAYVEQLLHAYTWCLIPWGVDYVGQMILFMSSDPTIFGKLMEWLAGSDYHELLVSAYTTEEVARQRFRGAIFYRLTDIRGQGVWDYGRGTSDSALILRAEQDERPQLPLGAEIVCDVRGYHFGPLHRRWIRVRTEDALLHYTEHHSTILITSVGLDERIQWLATQDFAGVSRTITADPLYFGLKALESVSWIYLPSDNHDRYEIYINHDPAVTTQLLTSDTLLREQYFTHRCFC